MEVLTCLCVTIYLHATMIYIPLSSILSSVIGWTEKQQAWMHTVLTRIYSWIAIRNCRGKASQLSRVFESVSNQQSSQVSNFCFGFHHAVFLYQCKVVLGFYFCFCQSLYINALKRVGFESSEIPSFKGGNSFYISSQ